MVAARPDEVQQVIDYFKSWLQPTHQIYVDELKKSMADLEEQQRVKLQNEIRQREERARVLQNIKL
jgi:hypothetical protein